MSMKDTEAQRQQLHRVLWEALAGGNYDLEKLKATIRDDQHLGRDLGIESLDIIEFHVRIQAAFGLAIGEADYEEATTIAGVFTLLRRHSLDGTESEGG